MLIAPKVPRVPMVPWVPVVPVVSVVSMVPIERLFDVTGRKTSATLSILFRFAHKTARQEGSKFYSDLRNASSLAPTKY